MKKTLFVLLASAVLGFAVVPAEAALIDRGGGLIYDTDLNITWLSDANYAQTSGYDADGVMSWSEALTWADGLVYGGYADWRLPVTVPCWGYCTSSEMGHLFYDELGGTGGSFIMTSGDPDLGLFTNIQSNLYWSGIYAGGGNAWAMDFNGSYHGAYPTFDHFRAWAVRDGDVTAVPEPGTMLLLGSGVLGLAFWRRKSVRKQG